jgi:hypothetical protein
LPHTRPSANLVARILPAILSPTRDPTRADQIAKLALVEAKNVKLV